jgi:hypothetical protein
MSEPRWMQEAEYVRGQRDDERERRMQQFEDEAPRVEFGTDTQESGE